MTDGGEGSNGYLLSEEGREEKRKRMKGSDNPMFGKDWRDGKTQEELDQHNINLSNSLKLFYQNNTSHMLGKKGTRLGSKNTEETNNAIRLKKIKPVLDLETFTIFKSYKEVAKFINVGESCMRARLNGQNINLTSFIYLKDYIELNNNIDYSVLICNITYLNSYVI